MRQADSGRRVALFTRRAALASTLAAIVSACSGPLSQGEDSAGTDIATPTASAAPGPTPPAQPSTPTSAAVSATPQPGAEATQPPSPTATQVADTETSSSEARTIGRAAPAFRPSLPREIHIPYVAVVSPKLQVRDISYDQLAALWNLHIDDWRELGDPVSSPVRRYSLPDMPLPLEPFGGDVPVDSYDDLAEALWRDRGGVAIIPTHMVDHRVGTLRINGVDVLRSHGAPNPLLLQLYGVPEEIAPETLLPKRKRAKLTFVGDIIFGRFVQVAMERRNDFAAPFRSISPALLPADLTIGNLECTLSDNYEQPERTDPQTFRFKTGSVTVSGLELADIDVLSRANNHSFDFGPGGMDDTSMTLDAAGIKHFGMGHTLAEAREPAICAIGELSFAFLGYNGISAAWDGATADSPGTSPMIEEYVRQDVSRLASAGHIVVPFFHWGVEYVAEPTLEQQRFAHVAIEAGAAAVIGSHPHWVQAIETYQGKPVIYSLGNFVFDQAWSRETTEGLIADLWFEGDKVLGVDLRPVLILEEHRPVLLDADNAYHVLERIWAASEPLHN